MQQIQRAPHNGIQAGEAFINLNMADTPGVRFGRVGESRPGTDDIFGSSAFKIVKQKNKRADQKHHIEV